MTGVRRLYLDVSAGETRGLVTLDGLPEILLIDRPDEPRAELGARFVGRVTALARGAGSAFVELGVGPPAVLKLAGPAAGLAEGAAVRVEVVAEARADKGPVVEFVADAAGHAVGPVESAPSVAEQLRAFAPDAAVTTGEAAREACDLAEEAALESTCLLKDGVAVTIEPTRALVAVDVDRAAGGAEPGRKGLKANLAAVRQAARLLRLKSLGGTVAIDLLGFPEPRAVLTEAAQAAFAPDGPGVAVLTPNRLGVLMLAKPHRRTPTIERLCDPDGRLSALTVACRLARRFEAEGAAQPGVLLEAVCPPDVAERLRPLAARLGPRFSVAAEVGRDRARADIRPR
ncbi:ribonuclease E/G [Caulobacter sp. 17J80-11]|uniref:ribonuclease E/G n=1 Tax=Caulobacter sp. 17J80-11 TaxID=2763502 RepID=UPI0016534D52|nr:ribonuclease E/G [Caulobacter sp. 17J80-11]